MKQKIQRAIFLNTPLEIREKGEGELMLVGLAAPYETLSEDLGGFREVIEPGAFGDLSREDVYAAPHHDPRQIVGRVSAGTLRLDDQEDGLHFEVDLPDTTAAKDLIESVKRGDIKGNSFTFSIEDPDEIDFSKEDGQWVQRVKPDSALLIEVAPGVVNPAYRETEVEVMRRSFEKWSGRQDSETDNVDREERLRQRSRELRL
jgi:HK97 family phage prohead protease